MLTWLLFHSSIYLSLYRMFILTEIKLDKDEAKQVTKMETDAPVATTETSSPDKTEKK